MKRAARLDSFLPFTLAAALSAPAGALAGSPGDRAHPSPPPTGVAPLRSRLELKPAAPEAGRPVTLALSVLDREGRAVSRLAPSHQAPLHLFVVSRDLRQFAHLHPSPAGDAFTVTHTFEAAGEYLVLADYQRPGAGQGIDRHTVTVRGRARAPAPLTETSTTQRSAGLEVTLRSGPLRAGEGAMLHFDVTDATTRTPVTNLQPYLGARAHFMVLSADLKDFVHVHPLDAAEGSARVSAHAEFPRPGLYKLWAQLRWGGEVITVPFVVRVGERAAPSGHAHHGH